MPSRRMPAIADALWQLAKQLGRQRPAPRPTTPCGNRAIRLARGRAAGCDSGARRAAPSASWSPRCSRSRSPSCRSTAASRAWRRAWRARCSRPTCRCRPAAGCLCSPPRRESDTRLQQRGRDLAPLFALAGIGGSDAVPQLDAAAIDGLAAAAAADAASPAERLFALLDGRRGRRSRPGLGAICCRRTPSARSPRRRARCGVAWSAPRPSAASARPSCTRCTMLDGRPQAGHPEALVACLRALRRVGLDRDARAIAVATALIDGL